MLKRKPRTVFALQEVLKPRGEIITKVFQSLLQLVAVDGVVMVFVETAKFTLPFLCPHCKNAYATARRQTPHTP
jgi:hypothetical protein